MAPGRRALLLAVTTIISVSITTTASPRSHLWSVSVSASSAACFAPAFTPATRRTGVSQTFVQFTEYPGIDQEGENEDDQGRAGGKKVKNHRRMVVPLIGPVPGAPPLLVGGAMTLDPPTPMQWGALQEAVVVHQNSLKREDAERQGLVEREEAAEEAEGGTIDAAPLVAVIDAVTGGGGTGTDAVPGRYATLAAVVGISSRRSYKSSDDRRTDDEESFFESMVAPFRGRGTIDPDRSTVRLVGIGRAQLRDYFHRKGTKLDGEVGPNTEEEDVLITETVGVLVDEEDWDGEGGIAEVPPVTMARFSPLVDHPVDPKASSDAVGRKGARPVRSSPVHSLHRLNTLSHKVNWMHDDRRRLVHGIRAAQARLELRFGQVGEDKDFVFDDYDGLGLTGSSQASDMNRARTLKEGVVDGDDISVEDLLARFDGVASEMLINDPLEALARAEDRRNAVTLLEGMDNLGIGLYGYFSSVPDLTQRSLEILAPYYSEEHREGEEHALEVATFCALRSLEAYAHPSDVSHALRCTSTAERFELIYEIMYDHRIKLEKMAEAIIEELRNCGEECEI